METITSSNSGAYHNIDSYSNLVENIGYVIADGQQMASVAVNVAMLETYWRIGQYIVEFEQKGSDRAVYGDKLLTTLSKDLKLRFGKKFSLSNLYNMRKLYVRFPIFQTLSGKLSWSHYLELLKLEDEQEISFYIQQSIIENWSVRELKRQIDSMLFHRLALSTDKSGVLELAKSGMIPTHPADIIKDPMVLEFVGLPEPIIKESELEDALIENLEQFLLELGKGFAFIGRQYRITLGGRHFKVDLVFYHRILKCFVLIDLKRGEIGYEDIGQMNLYLNYFKNEENTEGDNEPIGILLGASKDEITMQYALEGITTQLFVSRYQLYLPSREELQNRLQQLLS